MSYIRSYMFRSTRTIFRELILSLAKVIILQKYNFSQAQYKLPEDGPGWTETCSSECRTF